MESRGNDRTDERNEGKSILRSLRRPAAALRPARPDRANRELKVSSRFLILLLAMLSGCTGYEMREFLYFSKVDEAYRKQMRLLSRRDGFDRHRQSISLAGHEKCCDTVVKDGRGEVVYRHAAYAHRACAKCHGEPSKESAAAGEQMGKLAVPKERLCLQCHQAIKENKFTHGPIGVGECLQCHTPHISHLDSLLRLPDRAMCFTCHEKKDIARGKHHASIGGRGCLECHYPHGGDAKFFVKPTRTDSQ